MAAQILGQPFLIYGVRSIPPFKFNFCHTHAKFTTYPIVKPDNHFQVIAVITTTGRAIIFFDFGGAFSLILHSYNPGAFQPFTPIYTFLYSKVHV